MVKLAVRDMPGSGTPAELLAAAGIDADHIVKAVQVAAVRGLAVVSGQWSSCPPLTDH